MVPAGLPQLISKAGGSQETGCPVRTMVRHIQNSQCDVLGTEGDGLHVCAGVGAGGVEYKQAGVRENITAHAVPAWAVKLSRCPQDLILLPRALVTSRLCD